MRPVVGSARALPQGHAGNLQRIDSEQQQAGRMHGGRRQRRRGYGATPDAGARDAAFPYSVRRVCVHARHFRESVSAAHVAPPPLGKARHGGVVPRHLRCDPENPPAGGAQPDAQLGLFARYQGRVESAYSVECLKPHQEIATAFLLLAGGHIPLAVGHRIIDGGFRAAFAPAAGNDGDIVVCVEERTGIETRNTILGHIQRGGAPTGYDRVLATRLGMGAVDMVAQKQWGKMVSVQGTEVKYVPLEEALDGLKSVPQERWDEASVLFGR